MAEQESEEPCEPVTVTEMYDLSKEGIVRLRVNPPGSKDPTLMEDTYLNTGSLALMYAPRVSLTGDIPALSNLSAVFMWNPLQSLSGNEEHQGVTLTSYVIPSALLTIPSRPNGDYYDIMFEVTDKPTVLYYDYSSYEERFALYQPRSGQNGTQMVYLKPVQIGEVKMIKGVALPTGSDIPNEAFIFQLLDAKISRPSIVNVCVPETSVYLARCCIL